MSDNDVSKPNRVIKGSIKSGAAWEIHDLIESGNFDAKSLFDSRHKELESDGRRITDAKRNVHEELTEIDKVISNVSQAILKSFDSINDSANLVNSEQNAISGSDANLKNHDSLQDFNKNEKKEVIPPNSEDIIELRKEWQVFKDKRKGKKYEGKALHTLAVAKTDIKGLENEVFTGASRQVKAQSIPPQKQMDDIDKNRPVQAPSWAITAASSHAEEEVINKFIRAVQEAGIKPEDVKGEFWIHQSNPRGVCSTCLSGLGNAEKESGVVKQLSLLYPNLVINVSSDEVEGVKPCGRKFFKVQNGAYVED